MTPASASEIVCPVVAAALALQELGLMRAVEQLPTPEALLGRLRARETDFNLLVGVTSAFLKAPQA